LGQDSLPYAAQPRFIKSRGEFIMGRKKRKILYAGAVLGLTLVLVFVFYQPVLVSIGKWIVIDETPVKADAVVVLNTGLEIYPRIIHAADIYKQGFADLVVINGNRKTEALRKLEMKGFKPGCMWYDDMVSILRLLGVPREKVMVISAENAYDTVSEALAVGDRIINAGFKRVIIATSKFHTRRAGYIWKNLFGGRLEIRTVAAGTDPYAPGRWWKSRRQVRWVLAEYGAWVYYFWKRLA
jgi:uncharacterized SAM-binding protein YcdF (DUF218 family)